MTHKYESEKVFGIFGFKKDKLLIYKMITTSLSPEDVRELLLYSKALNHTRCPGIAEPLHRRLRPVKLRLELSSSS